MMRGCAVTFGHTGVTIATDRPVEQRLRTSDSALTPELVRQSIGITGTRGTCVRLRSRQSTRELEDAEVVVVEVSPSSSAAWRPRG